MKIPTELECFIEINLSVLAKKSAAESFVTGAYWLLEQARRWEFEHVKDDLRTTLELVEYLSKLCEKK